MVSVAFPSSDHVPACADADSELMTQVALHNSLALDQLYRRHRGALLAYFTKLGAREEREDLVQETFVRLHGYRHRYRRTSKFTSFLYTLARHAWIDHGRKCLRQNRLLDRYHVEMAAEPHPSMEAGSERIEIDAALAQLPPKMKRVVELHFFQGLKYGEISGTLDLPVGTVKSRMNHAMILMRGWLNGRL